MSLQFKNSFNKGINLDLDETRLPPDTAVFIKNLTNNININAGTPALSGSDAYVITPLEGNVSLIVSGMPGGTNYCVGFYSSEQTNEGYFAIYNSNGNHTVWVIAGATGAVTKVHQNTLLPFLLDPQYFYAEGRMTLELRSIIDPVTKSESNFKFLVFTNNNKNQCFIDVDASINTNSYTTAYFTSSAAFYNRLELIHLGSPLPIKCMGLNNPNAYTPVVLATIIDVLAINAPGTGYTVGSTVSINGAGTGATLIVTAIGAGGSVVSFIITSGGSAYVLATAVSTTTTGGGGSGLTVDVLQLVTPDASKQNLLVNEGWQFRVRTWDVFGRPSEWGIISTVYTSLIGGGCVATSNGLARCVNLCFDSGNPQVKFITVAYRRGVGNDPSGQTETGWYEHETFRKYDDSASVEWYNRPINPQFSAANSGMTFDPTTNQVTYTFCADKGSNPVDPTEAARTEPGLARTSGSVFSINKLLGLANNVYDFEPISQPVIDGIQFSAKLPNPSIPGQVPCPAAPLRTIVIYANLYNTYDDSSPLIRYTFGIVTFGDGGNSIAPNTVTCLVNNFSVAQVFGDQTNPGFIAYLAGTPFKVVGKWGNYNPGTGVFTENSTFSGGGFTDLKMTQFTFVDVPAGEYVVRLASHHATINDADLQKTSTQVAGVCPIFFCYSSGARFSGFASNPVKEIVVDCTAADVNLGTINDPMFVILDLNDGVRSNGIDGYLYEEIGGAPVEMAVCNIHGATLGTPGDAPGSFFTDHNGFYFVGSGSSYCGIDIFADLCDGSGIRGVFSATSGCGVVTTGIGGGKMLHGDGSNGNNPSYYGNYGDWKNKVYIARPGGVVSTYPSSANRTIKQILTICSQPTVGVPGVPVIMTKCQPALTDSSGLAQITAHNRYNYLAVLASQGVPTPPYHSDLIPDYGSSPGNEDLLIFSQKGGCEWNACGGCNSFMASATVIYLACGAPASGCATPQPARTLCLTTLSVQPNGVGIYGVQSGGKYPVAVWFHDVIGRHTSPQTKSGDAGYVFIPNLNDTAPTPYPSMSLTGLQVAIPAGLVIDTVFTRMTFLVGPNCLFGDYFSWAADWVQYIDNTGVTNVTNPTAIRIYFQSLNEYNKQYNFGTNIAWDFITKQQQQQSDTALPSDVVQFIMNGDGTWLSPQKGAPVTYDQFGAYFTIDYIPELAGLQNGCLFRVIRPKQNSTGVNLPYYEQCLTLDITNGVLPSGTWSIPYQDSYLLSRSVPVPLLKGETAPIPPGDAAPAIQYTSSNQSTPLDTDGYSQNNINNNNGVVIFQTIDDPATFPFFFESPSPSDLWGSHLSCQGRVGIPNPYEQQYRVGTEIALSNPLADKGIVNGIGTFLEQNRQIFDRNTFGDITVALVEMGVCMVICNNDFFITRYNQTQLQITENGQIVGQNPAGNIFTAPQTKVGSNYGIVPVNINSIQRYNGMVVFVDNKGHLIFSDFSTAKPTEKDGYMGYILNKISVLNIKNRTVDANGWTYWVGGIDPKNMEYILTAFNIPPQGGGNPSYINTDSVPVLGHNETLIFDLNTGTLKSFASFTPEMYGRMPGYFLQRQFISFKGGIPYIHHNNFANNVAPPLYCNFYGTQCEVRLTHVINGVDGKLLPDKVKRFLYSEIYCRENIPGGTGVMPSALFFADVITSEKGQISRLLVARWDLKDGYQCAAYLCAINTPPDPNRPVQTGANAILEGDPLQGRWVRVSITNNTLWAGTYFELSAKADYINFVEKSAV